MTRKDFELIASVLASFDCYGPTFADLCHSFAVRLKRENPQFNAKRFAKACNIPSELLEGFEARVNSVTESLRS